MTTLYIVGAIEYLMYKVKAPWWVMAVFGALILADIINYIVNEHKEKKDEEGNV